MKKNSLIRRALCLTGSAVMLAGLLSGGLLQNVSLAVPAQAAMSQPSAGDNFGAGDTCTVTADVLNIRSGPGLGYARRGSYTEGFTVTLEKVEGDWGKVGDGWIDLHYVTLSRRGSDPGSSLSYVQIQAGQTGYVTASSLNIRTGPGVGYALCGSLSKGYAVKVEKVSGEWGKIPEGWINLLYVRTDKASNPNKVIVNGSRVRVTADRLNVRQGPGTGYAKVDSLGWGEYVDLLEVRGNWGRYTGGWICLDYTVNTNGSTVKDQYRGSVVEVTADSLRIRTGPGTGYQQSGMLTEGYRVSIQEVNGNWGRIDLGGNTSGWICLDYTRAA